MESEKQSEKQSLTQIINERLDKIEDKVDKAVMKIIKEELDGAVKHYVSQLKEVIFTELLNSLLDKHREMEMKNNIELI